MRKSSLWSLIVAISLVAIFAGTGFIGKATAQEPTPNLKPSVLPLDLSRPPIKEELMAAGQLGGLLYPTHEAASNHREALINQSFGEAIDVWNRHRYPEAIVMFQNHVAEFPDSPWASEAMLHIGCNAFYHGCYTEAENCFNWVIRANQGSRHYGARAMVDKTRIRLANLREAQGNFSAAIRLLSAVKQSSSSWRDQTYASHWIQRLSRLRHQGLALYNCGLQALAQLLMQEGQKVAAKEILAKRPSSRRGQSIKELQSLAGAYGYQLDCRKLAVADLREIPLPALVQLNARQAGNHGHFWLLKEAEGDRLEFYDPQSRQRFRQTAAEFAQEWDGNALVLIRPGCAELPGRPLAAREMEHSWGGCCGVQRPPDNLGNPNKRDSDEDDPPSKCAPTWEVNPVNMNFYAVDTPLWYRPPIGPRVNVTLSYNSQASIAEHEPFGNKWQFKYSTYVVEDSGGTVTVFMPDGRNDVYYRDWVGGYRRPIHVYNDFTQAVSSGNSSEGLRKSADNRFELRFPDDTVYVYDIPAGTSSLQAFLVEIRDRHGQKLTFGYDANLHLTTITDALGKVTTLTYNAAGLVTAVTDPFGRSAAFEYDQDRNLVKITDMGGYWTSFAYDAHRFISGIANARGAWSIYTEPADGIANGSNPYPAPGTAMWQNYRITVTDPAGQKEEYRYNGYSGNGWYVSPMNYVDYTGPSKNNLNVPQTKYTYSNNWIASVTLPQGNGFRYAYDSNGNRTSIDDGQGTVKYTYNGMGRATSITNPYGAITNLTYDANEVDLTATQNSLGTTSLAYNAAHEVTSVTDRLGKVTTFTYNTYGQPTSATNALGQVTTYTYDAGHRLVEIAQAGQRQHSYTYDSLDRLSTHTDPTGLSRGFSYDSLDRITQISFPDGKFINYTYSRCCPHLVESITDRGGRTYLYSYDKLNLLQSETNPEGGVTRYAHDADGNLTQLIDPEGNITRFNYDNNNRLVKKTYPDGTYLLSSYNKAGLLTSKRNARGTETYYSYDAARRLKEISYTNNANPWINYDYDGHGRLIKASNALGTSLFAYDAMSRLTAVDGPWDNDTTSYQYDALGRRTGLAAAGGQPAAYAYDSLGRLKGVTVGGTAAYAYSYQGASPLVASLARPNNAGVTSYQYDPLNRLTGVANRDGAANIINQFDYTYNQQDQRSSETISGNQPPAAYASEATAYSYNRNNQLVSLSNPVKQTFSYDADGNLTRGYTPAGYPFTAVYDPGNRLKTLSFQDGAGFKYKTEYYYFGDQLARVKKFQNDVLVSDNRYMYDGFQVLQERDDANQTVNEYAWGLGLGGGIGGLLHLSQGGAAYSYVYDGKGNVAALLEGGGDVATAYQYDPFGRRLTQSGSLAQPLQFSTKPYDDKTGLSYYGFRFYAPAVGRWMTRDPISELGGINLYEFVRNNPLNYGDPLGLWAGVDDLIFTVGGGLVGVVGQGISDLISWKRSGWEDYTGSFVGGAVGGELLLYTGPVVAGMAGGAASNITKQGLKNISGKQCGLDPYSYILDTALGGIPFPGLEINGITAGSSSYKQIYLQMVTKMRNGTISEVSLQTSGKMFIGTTIESAPSAIIGAEVSPGLSNLLPSN
jgi:RHS repeat-associated protein